MPFLSVRKKGYAKIVSILAVISIVGGFCSAFVAAKSAQASTRQDMVTYEEHMHEVGSGAHFDGMLMMEGTGTPNGVAMMPCCKESGNTPVVMAEAVTGEKVKVKLDSAVVGSVSAGDDTRSPEEISGIFDSFRPPEGEILLTVKKRE